MTDLEDIGRQPDMIAASSTATPGNNVGPPQRDQEPSDRASSQAHTSSCALDFSRFKEALRIQPRELAPRLREPPDPETEAAQLGLWQRARVQSGLYSWHVLAPVSGLAMTLGFAAFMSGPGATWSTHTDGAPQTSLAGTTGQSRSEPPPSALRPAPPQPQPAGEIATAHVGDPGSRATALSITVAGNHAALPPGSSAAGRFNGDEEARAIFDRLGDGMLPTRSESSDRRMPMPLTVRLTASEGAVLSSGSRAAASTQLSEGVHVQTHPDRFGEEKLASSDDAYLRARRLLRSGERDAAEQAFRLSLERTSSPAAAYELGHLLQEQGRYTEAASSYQLAVQLAPERAYMLYDLGAALAKLERLDEAATMFERAAELDPTNPYILYDWGWALERTGAIEHAADKYRAAFAAGADAAAGKNARARLHQIGRYRMSSR